MDGCNCCGCLTGEECYFKHMDDTEDHKYLWEGIEQYPLSGIEKWIEEKCKNMSEGAWEKVPRNFPDSQYTGPQKYIWWDEIKNFFDVMDECEGGIVGVYQREMKRKEKKLNIGMCKFFTISPSGINQKDITEDKLLTYGRRIKKLYTDFEGVLEFGKHKHKPHLHLHYLGCIRNSKHHMRSLKTEWEKLFPGNKALHNQQKGDKEYFVSIHTESDKMIPYADWLEEKKTYFRNESKGSHENFRNSIVL